MFRIDFRITDNGEWLQNLSAKDFDKDGSGIAGYFQLTIGGSTHGYCHFRPLQEGELGDTWIDTWIDSLLLTLIHLPQTGYAAFRDVETRGVWIEAKGSEKDNVTISVANQVSVPEKEGHYEVFITRPIVDFCYDKILSTTVSFDVFKTEIIDNAVAFVEQVKTLNSNLISSMRISVLNERINEIR